jgi:hypothetical protein
MSLLDTQIVLEKPQQMRAGDAAGEMKMLL